MRNPIIAEALLILVLVILSDAVAALLAARSCWRIRNKARLAVPFAVVLAVLAVESLNSTVNHSINLHDVKLPTAYLVQAFIGRSLKAAATWYLALKLMNGSK